MPASIPHYIWAYCPEFKKRFQVRIEPIGLLRAESFEEAGAIVANLKSRGRMTYVFDKSLGREGRVAIPTRLPCPICEHDHKRQDLEYYIVASLDDTEL